MVHAGFIAVPQTVTAVKVKTLMNGSVNAHSDSAAGTGRLHFAAFVTISPANH